MEIHSCNTGASAGGYKDPASGTHLPIIFAINEYFLCNRVLPPFKLKRVPKIAIREGRMSRICEYYFRGPLLGGRAPKITGLTALSCLRQAPLLPWGRGSKHSLMRLFSHGDFATNRASERGDRYLPLKI